MASPQREMERSGQSTHVMGPNDIPTKRAIAMGTELEDDDDEVLQWTYNQQQLMTALSLLQPQIHGGSRPGKLPNIDRERQEGYRRMMKDYFIQNCIYTDAMFRQRFRMRRSLYFKIQNAICEHDQFFLQQRDASGVLGLSPHQKITVALRMLAHGISTDGTDEYCRILESTALKSLKRFVRGIRELFEDQYLRQPTRKDIQRQLHVNVECGFPGMFGSLDCMHYPSKNCPYGWQGQFMNKDGECSIILEAVVDHELWIWHVFFGVPGSNNDLNVLDKSPFVSSLLRQEDRKDFKFNVNEKEYDGFYFLTDSIFPKWSIFVQTIIEPQTPERKIYIVVQEGCRKDVERAFGVLQARWEIIKNPSRMWKMTVIKDILMACVILHNMITEDERRVEMDDYFQPRPVSIMQPAYREFKFDDLLEGTKELENETSHFTLRNDLIQHIYKLKGQGQM